MRPVEVAALPGEHESRDSYRRQRFFGVTTAIANAEAEAELAALRPGQGTQITAEFPLRPESLPSRTE